MNNQPATKKPFLSLDQIYQTRPIDFKQTFNNLNILNQILSAKLPDNLIPLCHVGAFDKTTVVIFVTNQQALHILKGFSNQLLQAFYTANFAFDNLLLKVRVSGNKTETISGEDDIEL